jgi:3-hydroxyacyl-[acyl-carrier-protein] dehydratase
MVYDIRQIMEKIPHRYPFLLIDRVVSIEDRKMVAIKNVTINEPFFNGHFPGFPIMPGVLIVEAMAQAGGLLAMHLQGEALGDRKVFFMTIDSARFRQPVVPGDQLRFEIEIEQRRGTIWRVFGKAFVGEKLVADAQLQAMITRDKEGA